MELITVKLDCEAILFRTVEQLLSFSDLPCFLFDKDINGCGQMTSGHLGNQFLAYLRHVAGTLCRDRGRYVDEQSRYDSRRRDCRKRLDCFEHREFGGRCKSVAGLDLDSGRSGCDQA